MQIHSWNSDKVSIYWRTNRAWKITCKCNLACGIIIGSVRRMQFRYLRNCLTIRAFIRWIHNRGNGVEGWKMLLMCWGHSGRDRDTHCIDIKEFFWMASPFTLRDRFEHLSLGFGRISPWISARLLAAPSFDKETERAQGRKHWHRRRKCIDPTIQNIAS